MEIAVGLMGVGLTTLGIIFAYIWKSNDILQRQMMTALERIEDGQLQMMAALERIGERMEQGQLLTLTESL